jgi:peptidoglycan/xylan/chitin deacetylase (PgdA/CDA1 family)
MQRRPAGDAPTARAAHARACTPTTWMYHSISDSTAPDPHLLRVHPDRLESQLRLLARAGIRGVSLHEALRARAAGDRSRLVALTFDDGYADFREHAMPLLAGFGMTATVYVVSDRLGMTNDWDADAPPLPLMTVADLRAVASAGHEVGCHGATHMHLAGATAEQLRHETAGSRAVLEDLLQQPVRGFCFPYGSHDDAAVAAAEAAGYAYACVTNTYSGRGPFRVPRYYVGQQDGAMRLVVKAVRHRVKSAS